METCLFCKIVAGDIPSAKVYEDEYCYAFRDINPQMPTHVLVVSKTHVANLTEAAQLNDEALAGILRAIGKIAAQEKLTDGIVLWRLVVCTSVHVSGAAVSGIGLSRAWRLASQSFGRFEISRVWPYVFGAMVLHGLYNLGALIYALHEG